MLFLQRYVWGINVTDYYPHSGGFITDYDSEDKCITHYRTMGLLGTYNGDATDDLIAHDCQQISKVLWFFFSPAYWVYEKCFFILYSQIEQPSPSSRNLQDIYYKFGEKWRVNGTNEIVLLFQSNQKPLYDARSFAAVNGHNNYQPVFDLDELIWNNTKQRFREIVATKEEIRVLLYNLFVSLTDCSLVFLFRSLALATIIASTTTW